MLGVLLAIVFVFAVIGLIIAGITATAILLCKFALPVIGIYVAYKILKGVLTGERSRE